MPFQRSSGLLLHITSLPSRGGIGDLGPAAYEFADFLAASRQRLWQVLPLNPVGYGNSPYGAVSAFAGNPLLISLELLASWGWLPVERLDSIPVHHGSKVDFDEVRRTKLPLLAEAARAFLADRPPDQYARFEEFCREQQSWLDDFATFTVLRRKYGSAAWSTWPEEIARRDSAALEEIRREHCDEIACERAVQFAFDEQWKALRRYCADRGIQFIGDVAIFVSFDSADVWTHPEIFELDTNLQPKRVSGVPPDYFSANGQRWGNPLYKWDVLESRRFDWWVDRMRRAYELYDLIRLDHFRGFEAYWAIPADQETAIHGEWIKAPGSALFRRLREALGGLPVIAEDLGLITQEVEDLRREFDLPGMRVLQFGFSSRGAHNHLPHRFERNAVVYTGTHDNDTTEGWWRHGASQVEIAAAREYLGEVGENVVWPLIRAASSSVADLCVFPVQDILGYGSEARMNTPAEPADNWTWRLRPGVLTPELAERMAALCAVTDRDGVGLTPEEAASQS
jgi:4-alpha-glucanotransferase